MNSKLNIYTALGADGYELCQPIDSEGFARFRFETDGVPKQSIWKPIPVQIFHRERRQKLRISDSPWYGCDPLIFRASVVEALGQVLLEYGELLPLECAEAELWIYNTTRLIDALDVEASEIARLSSGKIIRIDRPVFRAEVIGDIDIFKLSIHRLGSTYFSQRFVDLWKASGLKGLDFVQENGVYLPSLWAKPERKKRKKSGASPEIP